MSRQCVSVLWGDGSLCTEWAAFSEVRIQFVRLRDTILAARVVSVGVLLWRLFWLSSLQDPTNGLHDFTLQHLQSDMLHCLSHFTVLWLSTLWDMKLAWDSLGNLSQHHLLVFLSKMLSFCGNLVVSEDWHDIIIYLYILHQGNLLFFCSFCNLYTFVAATRPFALLKQLLNKRNVNLNMMSLT